VLNVIYVTGVLGVIYYVTEVPDVIYWLCNGSAGCNLLIM